MGASFIAVLLYVTEAAPSNPPPLHVSSIHASALSCPSPAKPLICAVYSTACDVHSGDCMAAAGGMHQALVLPSHTHASAALIRVHVPLDAHQKGCSCGRRRRGAAHSSPAGPRPRPWRGAHPAGAGRGRVRRAASSGWRGCALLQTRPTSPAHCPTGTVCGIMHAGRQAGFGKNGHPLLDCTSGRERHARGGSGFT